MESIQDNFPDEQRRALGLGDDQPEEVASDAPTDGKINYYL